jgi:hypothetical protein
VRGQNVRRKFSDLACKNPIFQILWKFDNIFSRKGESIMCCWKRILFIISSLIIFLPLWEGVAFSQSIPFETIDRGEISYFNYGDPIFLGADMVIKDHKTWVWFWVRHTQGIHPAPPIPRVDFRREMVLAVMLGFQTSGGGPSIEISSLDEIWSIDFENSMMIPRRFSMGIRVLVKDHREPGPLDVITNPYHIVKVRSNYTSAIFQHQPKDNPCRENKQCSENEYCEKPLGSCDGTGICKAKPQACIELYDPICGCDGKTYGNGCIAASEGVSILHRGSCEVTISCMKNEDCGSNHFCLFPEGACSGPGTCTPKPTVCPLMPCILEYGVCGCDGRSYCNLCEAYANGASILKIGECPTEQGCLSSGGTVTTTPCCQSVGDFPNTCGIGPCGCAPANSHEVNICDCGVGKCFNGSRCVPLHSP